MSTSDILFEVSDGIALVTLNRPEHLNAYSGAQAAGKGEVLINAPIRTGGGTVVISGARADLAPGLNRIGCCPRHQSTAL